MSFGGGPKPPAALPEAAQAPQAPTHKGRRKKVRAGTLLTSGQGDTSSADVTRKTLLGG